MPGGVERARSIAKRLNAPLAIIDKRREEANVAEVMNVIGEVAGPELPDCGRSDRYGRHAGEGRRGADGAGRGERHGLCDARGVVGPAIERISKSVIREVVVSNSIPLTEEARKCGKIRQLSVAPLLASAVQSIHEETSVSQLFL